MIHQVCQMQCSFSSKISLRQASEVLQCLGCACCWRLLVQNSLCEVQHFSWKCCGLRTKGSKGMFSWNIHRQKSIKMANLSASTYFNNQKRWQMLLLMSKASVPECVPGMIRHYHFHPLTIWPQAPHGPTQVALVISQIARMARKQPEWMCLTDPMPADVPITLKMENDESVIKCLKPPPLRLTHELHPVVCSHLRPVSTIINPNRLQHSRCPIQRRPKSPC